MGRTLMILLVGFAISFGLLASSKSRRFLDSVDRAVEQFTDYSATNAANSGVYMALNRLYQSNTWRTGYSNLVIAGDTVSVVVDDQTTDSTLADRRIRVRATGHNKDATNVTQALLFDGTFGEFAVWAKDTTAGVTTKTSLGVPDTSLLMKKAPFMPKIDYSDLVNAAGAQGHSYVSSDWQPADGYPNGSFYNLLTTPNVTHVDGNMKVKDNRTIYGIFVVEGWVQIEGGGEVRGILYLPNAGSYVRGKGGDAAQTANVNGGVLVWGRVNGLERAVSVQYNSTYMNIFKNTYGENNPPLRVLTWQ